jgi:hypothetical protein
VEWRRCVCRPLAPRARPSTPPHLHPRPQVLSTPAYAAAARTASSAAQLLAGAKPPLEAAVLEVELALVTRGYGGYTPYPRGPGGAGGEGALSSSSGAGGGARAEL